MDGRDAIILVLATMCLLMTGFGIATGWYYGAASVYRRWGNSLEEQRLSRMRDLERLLRRPHAVDNGKEQGQ